MNEALSMSNPSGDALATVEPVVGSHAAQAFPDL
jgi:hypothetical protein